MANKDLQLLAQTAIRLASLNLHGCRRVSGDGIFALSALTRLTSLGISYCGKAKAIQYGSLASLQHMPCLSRLTLANGRYTPLSWLPMGYVTCLTHLNLAECTKVCQSDLRVISSLQHLQSLDLSCCRVLTDDSMICMTPLVQLTSLTLQGNSSITDAVMSILQCLTRIELLDVRNCCHIIEVALDLLHCRLLRLRQLKSNGVDLKVVPLRAMQRYTLVSL